MARARSRSYAFLTEAVARFQHGRNFCRREWHDPVRLDVARQLYSLRRVLFCPIAIKAEAEEHPQDFQFLGRSDP